MIYLVCLDGGRSDGPGKQIDDWIRRNYENYVQPIHGCWIVNGPLVADQINTALAPLLAPSDRLLIVKAATEAMWHGIDESDARWIAENFPGSLSERIPGKTEGLS